jgi:FkbM family methyltransferase
MVGAFFKKLIRSIQVFVPGLAEAKSVAHHWFYRRTGCLFKADYGGLARFPWRAKLLVDIGANRGQSIVAFQNAVPDCQIVAFEANALLADRLTARFADSGRIRIEACALAAVPGSVTLYIPLYNGWPFDGLASLHRREAEGWLNANRLYWFDPQKLVIRESRVPARTLDSYGLEPVFMKLHVQRSEIEVLQGAGETLRKHRPVLLCAYPWDALIEFLARRGYEPHAFDRGRFIAGKLGREFTWFLLDEHVTALGNRVVASRKDQVSAVTRNMALEVEQTVMRS